MIFFVILETGCIQCFSLKFVSIYILEIAWAIVITLNKVLQIKNTNIIMNSERNCVQIGPFQQKRPGEANWECERIPPFYYI